MAQLPGLPPFADLPNCKKCNSEFGLFLRKHHCRCLRNICPVLQFALKSASHSYSTLESISFKVVSLSISNSIKEDSLSVFMSWGILGSCLVRIGSGPRANRNCGLTFCSPCSAKEAPLPGFRIADPLRVCDSCFDALINESTVHSARNNYLTCIAQYQHAIPSSLNHKQQWLSLTIYTMHKSIIAKHRIATFHSQLIEEAKNGNAAEVDRFIRGGVKKDTKDKVRVITGR
jgi:hypothetical protein